VKINIEELSDELAANPRLADYDYWRALKILNNEIFEIGRSKAPIPIQIIQMRAVLYRARIKRRCARTGSIEPRLTP
jgi:hypothetical protein